MIEGLTKLGLKKAMEMAMAISMTISMAILIEMENSIEIAKKFQKRKKLL